MKINKNKVLPHINLAIVLFLIVMAWIKVHWSVALLLGYMAVSLAMFAHALKRMEGDIKVLARELNRIINQKPIFQTSVEVVPAQPSVPVCQECLAHPTGIRIGSAHMRNASNCLMRNVEYGDTITEQQQ